MQAITPEVRGFNGVSTGGMALVSDDGCTWRAGTMKKGANLVREAVINGDGATDFCARFLDADEKPLRGFTVILTDTAR